MMNLPMGAVIAASSAVIITNPIIGKMIVLVVVVWVVEIPMGIEGSGYTDVNRTAG